MFESVEFSDFKDYSIIIVTIICVLVLGVQISPTMAAYELTVYRLNQFEVQNEQFGCQNAVVNTKLVHYRNWNLSRHCIFIPIADFPANRIDAMLTKSAGLLFVLPPLISNLTAYQKMVIMSVEKLLTNQSIEIPIYFAKWSKDIAEIELNLMKMSTSLDTHSHTLQNNQYGNVIDNDDDNNEKSKIFRFLNWIFVEDMIQIVINTEIAPFKIYDQQIPVFEGILKSNSNRNSPKIASIAFVTHFDSFCSIPELCFGSDSNTSGLAFMFELIRILSHFHKTFEKSKRFPFNLLFLITGGAKINYFGTKNWLRNHFDLNDNKLVFVSCFESLAYDSTIYMHMTKQPRNESLTHKLSESLKKTAEKHSIKFQATFKKVSGLSDVLTWEHETFSLRRQSAFTLTTLNDSRHLHRSTYLDTDDIFDFDLFAKNSDFYVKSLLDVLYDRSVVKNTIVNKDLLWNWQRRLSKISKSMQFLSKKDNDLFAQIENYMKEMLTETNVHFFKSDKKDPEFAFYYPTIGHATICRSKSAVFDFILSILTILYLQIVYLTVSYFGVFYHFALKMLSNRKTQ